MAGRGTNAGRLHHHGAVVPVDPTVAPTVAPTVTPAVAPAVHQPCAAARNQRDCHLPTQYHDPVEDSEIFNIDDMSEESSEEEVAPNCPQAQHSNLVPPANAVPTAQTTLNPTCTPAATLAPLMMAPSTGTGSVDVTGAETDGRTTADITHFFTKTKHVNTTCNHCK